MCDINPRGTIVTFHFDKSISSRSHNAACQGGVTAVWRRPSARVSLSCQDNLGRSALMRRHVEISALVSACQSWSESRSSRWWCRLSAAVNEPAPPETELAEETVGDTDAVMSSQGLLTAFLRSPPCFNRSRSLKQFNFSNTTALIYRRVRVLQDKKSSYNLPEGVLMIHEKKVVVLREIQL